MPGMPALSFRPSFPARPSEDRRRDPLPLVHLKPGAHTDSAWLRPYSWAVYTVTVFTGCFGCQFGAVGGGKDLTCLAKKAARPLVWAGPK